MKYQLIQMNELLDNALNHASIMTWAYVLFRAYG